MVFSTPTPDTVVFHPSMAEAYRERVSRLIRSLGSTAVMEDAKEALRALISEVRMVPDADAPGGHQLELVGELAGLMALGASESKKPPLFA
ncbi:recombinase family protein, partial [Leisingera sp. JC11]